MTDRDTVVVNGGGSSTGVLLGIVAIVLVLAAELPSVPPAE